MTPKSDLDGHGIHLDLPRLENEDGVSYYKRLRSVIPQRGGPHKRGLVAAITRELGYEQKMAIEIEPKTVNGEWIAQSPHVEVTSTKIILYTRYVSSTDNDIEMELDRYDHGSSYLLNGLMDLLHNSEYFISTLTTYMTGNEESYGLIPETSAKVVRDQVVPPTTFFTLDYQNIIPGTLFFDDNEIFNYEASPEVASLASEGVSMAFSLNQYTTKYGEYYVDYKNGLVRVHSAPVRYERCRYMYRRFPFTIWWSPVAVYSTRDTEYRAKLFETETLPSNETRYGLITDHGRIVYSTAFEKSLSLWGE
jgi:hypothetical protein